MHDLDYSDYDLMDAEESREATCSECGEEFEAIPEYCCSGYECGCEGMSSMPEVCGGCEG